MIACVMVGCVGAAAALGGEVKGDAGYAACRVAALVGGPGDCEADLDPGPDADPFPLPDQDAIDVLGAEIWVRADPNALPVRMQVPQGMSVSDYAALLADEGLRGETEPHVIRAAEAAAGGESISSEGRGNVEALRAKYGDENIKLVLAPPSTEVAAKGLLRRYLPFAVADFFLGAAEAEPPDDFFGGPWTVAVDGGEVEVTRASLHGGQDCLVLSDGNSQVRDACLAEGSEYYVSSATGDVLASTGPMGPVLDRDAVRQEAQRLHEQAAPSLAKPRKGREPDYVMGVVVDPYRWVQGPDGKWIDQTDGSVHDRPDVAVATPLARQAIRTTSYQHHREWHRHLGHVLDDLALMLARQVDLFDADNPHPAARGWLVLKMVAAEVRAGPSGRSAAELVTQAMKRIAERQESPRGLLEGAANELGTKGNNSAVWAAARERAQDRWEAWTWVEELSDTDWERARRDVDAMRDVLVGAARLSDVSATHRSRASSLASARMAEKLAQAQRQGDREAAILSLLDVAQVDYLDIRPVEALIEELATWWTEPLARRLPADVTNAITNVIGVPGGVDVEAITSSLDPLEFQKALSALRSWITDHGFVPSQSTFAVRGHSSYDDSDWLDTVRVATGVEAMEPYLRVNVLRAESDNPRLTDRHDRMLNDDGSRNWEAMVGRALRREPNQDSFLESASEDRRHALTLAFGPRLDDFVDYVSEELGTTNDWTGHPRAGTYPELDETINAVHVHELSATTDAFLRYGPDPYLATAVLEASRILGAYADKWMLTQTSESFLEDELLREATFAGTDVVSASGGAPQIYREIIVEGGLTMAQSYLQLLGDESGATPEERERLASQLDDVRGATMTIAARAPFGLVAPRSREVTSSGTYDSDGRFQIPRDIEYRFGTPSNAHTATGDGCPVAHGYVGVCAGELKPRNSLERLIKVFNQLTREALRRGTAPGPPVLPRDR